MNTVLIIIGVVGFVVLLVFVFGLSAQLGRDSRSMEDFLSRAHELENTTWTYDTTETTTSGCPVDHK